jgi:anti-sigma regulatory factor (Ser/Thr protein kinase)
MEVMCTQQIAVTERSQVSAARAAARELAAASGLDETDAHRAGLVATELATNLVKHAHAGGELLLRVVASASAGGELELLAVDRGPGIVDVGRSLADGHSSAGSMGSGLGAIRRLSNTFDLYSAPSAGTVVLSRIRPPRAPVADGAIHCGVVSVPKPGESVCGDGWVVDIEGETAVVAVADGLGHGAGAREASAAALAIVSRRSGAGLPDTLQQIHAGIRHTRGAACAIARLSRHAPTIAFAGVGNVAGVIADDRGMRHAVSSKGTLGHYAGTFREFQYPWSPTSVLIVHTDGLGTHWTFDRYPGLLRRHPSVIAAVLYRDSSRQRDDVTVLVVREAA